MQDYFLELLDYNKETGKLFWKKRSGCSRSVNVFNSMYAGKEAGNTISPKRSNTKYLAVKINGKTYKAHRVIFSMMTGDLPEQVDHIDHNGLNNKWENLRASNNFDNSRNLPMQKSNKSGFIGVNWHKSAKKWQARAVDQNGNRVDLGRYDSIDDAVKVREKYEKEFKYKCYRDNVK